MNGSSFTPINQYPTKQSETKTMLNRPNNLVPHTDCGPIRWIVPALLGVFLSATTHAGIDLSTEEAEAAAVTAEGAGTEAKAIRVDSPENEPLKVVLEPTEDSFRVDEPIRFKIRGNKDFFLYLFSIDKETEQATLILPSKEGQKHNKYPANRTLRCPIAASRTSCRMRPAARHW